MRHSPPFLTTTARLAWRLRKSSYDDGSLNAARRRVRLGLLSACDDPGDCARPATARRQQMLMQFARLKPS